MAESRSNNNFVREVTRNGNNNAWQTSIDDCFFFLHSACTRDDCPFRHEPAARSNSEMCTYWKAGHCTRRGCKFRHFDGNSGKRKTECKWESRAGGCCKPHCPYEHVTRSKLGSEPLLPTSLPKMIKHQNLENILLRFFEEYFKVYDSDNRQPLLNAYCENAVMSLHAVGSMEDMEAYIEQSRNLLRASEKQVDFKWSLSTPAFPALGIISNPLHWTSHLNPRIMWPLYPQRNSFRHISDKGTNGLLPGLP